MYQIERKTIEDFNCTLQAKGISLVCAESMTGGLFTSTISSANGALSILKGGIIAYDEDIKTTWLKVPKFIIEEHTAESQEVTDAMCEGLRTLYPYASLFVAITGVAEGTPLNSTPEGQIYVSIHYKGELHRYSPVLFPKQKDDSRNNIRIQAVEFLIEKILYLVMHPSTPSRSTSD